MFESTHSFICGNISGYLARIRFCQIAAQTVENTLISHKDAQFISSTLERKKLNQTLLVICYLLFVI